LVSGRSSQRAMKQLNSVSAACQLQRHARGTRHSYAMSSATLGKAQNGLVTSAGPGGMP
jgi:hypothetical protein